jgi:peroxiredoxin
MAVGVGEAAPLLDRTFPDANGEARSILAALEQGPVVLAIYKSSCVASKVMLPALKRVAALDPRVTVLGVSQDSANIARSFARRYDVDYPILVEGDGYLLMAAFATPPWDSSGPSSTR